MKTKLTFENPKFGAFDCCWLMSKRLKTGTKKKQILILSTIQLSYNYEVNSTVLCVPIGKIFNLI